MHPLLKDPRSLALYLLAWLAPGFVLAALIATSGAAPWGGAMLFALPATLVYAFMSLAAHYVCRAFPPGAAGLPRVLLPVLVAACLSAALWTGVCYVWASAIESAAPGLAPRQAYPASLTLLVPFAVALFVIAAAVHYLIATFAAARTREMEALELQVLARDAELKALRAQVDPHFLFNSLNSISALTSADPAAAREMTLLLADFFRLSLRYGALETITLEQELALAARFLAIEKVRFGRRLDVRTAAGEETLPALVPPLILQPLMENAVNHGIARLPGGGSVHLASERLASRLRLTVTNPVDDTPGTAGQGKGLAIVRGRLARLYGAEARCEAAQSPGRFTVVLEIPYHAAPEGMQGNEETYARHDR
ncbi:MAG TPA: histidine kinase [Bacteroidota bacterium]|nr:histidine kinase [Bacteroidota bacterium]